MKWSEEQLKLLSSIGDSIKSCNSFQGVIEMLTNEFGFECGLHLETLLIEECNKAVVRHSNIEKYDRLDMEYSINDPYKYTSNMD